MAHQPGKRQRPARHSSPVPRPSSRPGKQPYRIHGTAWSDREGLSPVHIHGGARAAVSVAEADDRAKPAPPQRPQPRPTSRVAPGKPDRERLEPRLPAEGYVTAGGAAGRLRDQRSRRPDRRLRTWRRPTMNGRHRRRSRRRNKSNSSQRGYRNCKRERSVNSGCKSMSTHCSPSFDSIADERPAAFFGAATVGACNQSLWSGDGNKKHKWMRHRARPARTPQLNSHMPSLTKSCYCFSTLMAGHREAPYRASVAEFEAAWHQERLTRQ